MSLIIYFFSVCFDRPGAGAKRVVYSPKPLLLFNNYSKSARWIWVGYNHLISNKREWNNCFIKNAHKLSRILPDVICKNNRFSASFKFWADSDSYHIWRAWYSGSYTIMAKPIRALELPYPMIHFLTIRDNTARLAPTPQDS